MSRSVGYSADGCREAAGAYPMLVEGGSRESRKCWLQRSANACDQSRQDFRPEDAERDHLGRTRVASHAIGSSWRRAFARDDGSLAARSRAVSTAYYAVFHALRALRRRVSRQVDAADELRRVYRRSNAIRERLSVPRTVADTRRHRRSAALSRSQTTEADYAPESPVPRRTCRRREHAAAARWRRGARRRRAAWRYH